MGLFNNFPYTNFHELNLDWLLRKMKELEAAWYSWKAVNQIVFANPVEWSTSQTYAQHVIVIHNGIGYLSRKPVPAGVNIEDPEYWEQITNFGDSYDKKDHVIKMQGAITDPDESEEYVQTMQMNDTVIPIRDATSFRRSQVNANDIENMKPFVTQSTADLDIIKDGIAIYTGDKTIDGIQKAINALPAHSTLVLPRGTYSAVSTAGLNIPYPFHLQGATTGFNGDNEVTLEGFISVGSSGVQLSNIAVRRKNANAFAIFGDNCYIEHCVAYGTGKTANGFYVNYTNKDVTFVDCRAEDCNTGFELSGSNSSYVEDVLMIDCYANNCNIGINANYANGTTVIDGSIENCNTGMNAGHGSTTLIGCVFSAIDLWGINLKDSAIFVEDCRFAQCNKSNTSGAGCIFNSNSEAIIFNSTVVDFNVGKDRSLMNIADGGSGIGFGNNYGYSMWGSEAKGFGLKNWNSANVIGHGDNTKTYADITDPTTLN